MFSGLRSRFARSLSAAARRVGHALREVLRPTPIVTGFLRDTLRSSSDLLAENALLRQQLIVASRQVKRVRFRPYERGIVVALSSLLNNWRNTLLLVKAETVLRWHREGFRLFWKQRSRSAKRCEPRISQETIELVRQMARDNRVWGAERIRGELLKLGLRVAKRTIQRHIRAVRPPGDGQQWRVFLNNHTVWACDFLQVYDVWFRPIFAFFIVDVNTKEVVHVAVTRQPSERWTAQQLRNTTTFCAGPAFIIRDNDNKFGIEFDRVAEGAGSRVLKTAVHAPLMNATCERFLGSVRRECLDHLIILGEAHLRSVLREYVAHFNAGRPHQGIAQRVPSPGPDDVCGSTATIVATPVLGGLHHDYRRAA